MNGAVGSPCVVHHYHFDIFVPCSSHFLIVSLTVSLSHTVTCNCLYCISVFSISYDGLNIVTGGENTL